MRESPFSPAMRTARDRVTYLELLRQYSQLYEPSLPSYGLMSKTCV